MSRADELRERWRCADWLFDDDERAGGFKHVADDAIAALEDAEAKNGRLREALRYARVFVISTASGDRCRQRIDAALSAGAPAPKPETQETTK